MVEGLGSMGEERNQIEAVFREPALSAHNAAFLFVHDDDGGGGVAELHSSSPGVNFLLTRYWQSSRLPAGSYRRRCVHETPAFYLDTGDEPNQREVCQLGFCSTCGATSSLQRDFKCNESVGVRRRLAL